MYKIAIVGDNIGEGVSGGAFVALTLASKLNELDFNTCVFTNSLSEIKQLYDIGIEDNIFNFPIKRFTCSPNALGYISPKQFYKEIDAFHPDIIHTTSNSPITLWAITYGNKHSIPTIFTNQGRPGWTIDHFKTPFKPKNPLHKLIFKMKTSQFKKLVNNASYLTAVSEIALQDLEQFVKGGYKKIKIIRNGFDSERFDNITLKQNNFNIQIESDIIKMFNPSTFNLLYVGRVSFEKNIDFSIDICKKLQKMNINYKFYIVGKGNYEDHIISRIKEDKLENNVILLGYRNYEELKYIYSKCDIFLFPSVYDTDGLVVKEANSCGCPALVIENTGASEQIENDTNGFALPNNVNAFVEKISKLADIKKNESGEYEALRERTKNKKIPSWDEIIQQYIEVYNEALNK